MSRLDYAVGPGVGRRGRSEVLKCMDGSFGSHTSTPFGPLSLV